MAKRACWAASLTILMLAAMACTSAPGSDPDQPATESPDVAPSEEMSGSVLSVWIDPNLVGALELVAPQFHAATGFEIDVKVMALDDIRTEVAMAAASSDGPDIFAGRHWWTGQLVEDNLVVPLDLSSIADQLVGPVSDGFLYNQRSYGLPYGAESLVLYRNTDMVADAPESFEQIIDHCAIAEPEMCLLVPGGHEQGDAFHNYPFVSAFGGYTVGFEDGVGFDRSDFGLESEQTIQGLEYLGMLVTDDVLASTNYEQAKRGFLDGLAPYYVTGPWEYDNIVESEISFEVSVIPPIGDAPSQSFVEAGGLFLAARSQHKLPAVSLLLDYLATEQAMALINESSAMATPWAALVSPDEEATGDIRAVLYQSVADGVVVPNLARMDELWQPLGAQLLAVRQGERSPRRAMSAISEVFEATGR